MDALILGFDRALRAVAGVHRAQRSSPVAGVDRMSERERSHSAALMRVNHCGEVCAQALYQAQASFAKSAATSEALRRSAEDELDHLQWTAGRVDELGGQLSALRGLWYLGAFGVGAIAANLGDPWNLGFLKETERQVAQHLSLHLAELPEGDERSRAILLQMRLDESSHAQLAGEMGGFDLPPTALVLMRLSSGMMTRLSYYL